MQSPEVRSAVDEAVDGLRQVTERLPAGELRTQQLDMCRSVARAIEAGRHLVVEAGTGTGKSLAYLVPAVTSGHKVVVATATKALQDQLADKDLPAVAAAIDRPFSFAVLKGRRRAIGRSFVLDQRGLQPALGYLGGPLPAQIVAPALQHGERERPVDGRGHGREILVGQLIL